MNFEELVKPDNVLCNAQARSKKHCLEILSELLARSEGELSSDEIFGRIIDRERLGCTSLGAGIAFPHCRVDGLERSCGALMKLSAPVDFDATDGADVDLVFGLMVPRNLDDTHHAEISAIAAALMDETLRDRLRAAHTSKELYDALLAGGDVASADAAGRTRHEAAR